jgi:hypothetical protein
MVSTMMQRPARCEDKLTDIVSSTQQLASGDEFILGDAGIGHVRVVDENLHLQVLAKYVNKEEQIAGCAYCVDAAWIP